MLLICFIALGAIWLYFCFHLAFKKVQRSPPLHSRMLKQRLQKWRSLMNRPISREGGMGRGPQYKRDGEAIAFVRLYALARQNKSSVSLPAFCEQVAPFLPHLRQMLLSFSQRISLEGSVRAFEWLEKQFPERHLFIHQLCTFLQTADQLPDPTDFIDQNTQMLDRISRDHYESRRKAIAPFLNTLNAIPAALVFFMVLLLVLKFMAITRSQIYY